MLHTISYTDDRVERPILHRASICEMIVPYGDPVEQYYRKNAFDIGEYGLGMLANSLTLGCDCLGLIRYFDFPLVNSLGKVTPLKNAVCLHEEDYGILWKHTDWRTGQSEVRRSRRLSVSFIATVGNYEHGFYRYFYQDGSLQSEVKLTGIMNTTSLAPGKTPPYGIEVAPQLNAPFHPAHLRGAAGAHRGRPPQFGLWSVAGQYLISQAFKSPWSAKTYSLLSWIRTQVGGGAGRQVAVGLLKENAHRFPDPVEIPAANKFHGDVGHAIFFRDVRNPYWRARGAPQRVSRLHRSGSGRCRKFAGTTGSFDGNVG